MSRVFQVIFLFALLSLGLAACDVFRLVPTRVPSPKLEQTTPDAQVDEHLRRGDAFFEAENYPQAVAEYTLAIQANPNRAESYNNRGLAYARLAQSDDALADYNKALELRPDYPNALTNRAIILYDRGDYDAVIRDTARAVDLDPNADSAYMFLGNAFAAQGNYFAAVRNWFQANSIRLARKNQ